MTDDDNTPAKQRSGGGSGILKSLLILVIAVVALSFLLRMFVFQAYQIPSASMETTIMTGDMVFSEKISYYLHPVEQGDVVTFIDPEDSSRTLIKRCIATGGQTVDLKDGSVYVDGQKLEESYTHGKQSNPLQNPNGISFPYTVPEGYLWMMGDNRTNSQDSRYFGAVPTSSVTGHAALIYWPLNQFGVLGK